MALIDLPNPKWNLTGKQVICKDDFKIIEEAVLERRINDVYYNETDVNPGTELGYGTWKLAQLISAESQYPQGQNDTYVMATSRDGSIQAACKATDPTLSLTGSYSGNQWESLSGQITNQRFHIDLGTAIAIVKIYYENGHNYGNTANYDSKDFSFWGSNDPVDFNELNYLIDGNWVLLTSEPFDQHVASDIADPKYFTFANTVAYRYYAFKIANGWAATTNLGIRRLVLQASPKQLWVRTA